MQVKKILVSIPESALQMIDAISRLQNESRPININQIAKETGFKWETVQRNLKENFKIKKIKEIA